MTKDVRLSVRVTQPGADALDKVGQEAEVSDRSTVIREFLAVGVTTPATRSEVVRRLKQRKGI